MYMYNVMLQYEFILVELALDTNAFVCVNKWLV